MHPHACPMPPHVHPPEAGLNERPSQHIGACRDSIAEEGGVWDTVTLKAQLVKLRAPHGGGGLALRGWVGREGGRGRLSGPT
jgi:hypothetical protein